MSDINIFNDSGFMPLRISASRIRLRISYITNRWLDSTELIRPIDKKINAANELKRNNMPVPILNFRRTGGKKNKK
jgi:hypothetical protein